MLNTSNKLIVREGRRLSGNKLVDTNHLNSFLMQDKPEMFNNAIRLMFSARAIQSNPITELTEGREKVRMLTTESDYWTWKMGKAPVCARVTENLESSNLTPGIDRLSFKVKLDQDWFSQGEIISPDKEKQVRVSSQIKPYKDGNGWVYVVELVTDDANDFLDPKFLEVGSEWVTLYGMYGEMAQQSTGVHFDSHIELINYMPDMIRKSHTVSGYVDDKVLTIENWSWDYITNKPIELNDVKWISRAEVEFWKQFNQEKENSLFYGRGSSDIKGESGYSIRTPYGFKQQLEWGNNETYNTFSMKLLREFLMDIFFGRVNMENRNVTLLTGEYGFMLFDQAVKQEANNFIFPADKVLSGSGMNMGFGYQFTTYRMINGGTITLKHLPSLDTKITNNMRSTVTGYPKESANFYIMDLSGEGADNIWMVRRPNTLKYGYVVGTSAPWALKGGPISNEIDGFKMIARDRVGIHIEDLSKTAVLRLAE